MHKKKIVAIFGTRPEAIKMCPLVCELKARNNLDTVVCVTGQHRGMLDQVLDVFKVSPDYDLDIMQANQTLFDITTHVLRNIQDIIHRETPDVVLVHGDTTTAFATSIACFYSQIPIGHVEAGLRTYNLNAPYPEEFNRQAIDIVSRYLFAPTDNAKENLIRENKNPAHIFVTGNTVIDALAYTVKEHYTHPELDWVKNRRLILITAHRRENLGAPLRSMFRAISQIAKEFPDIAVIYPIHMNPRVRNVAEEILSDTANIRIIEPLDVFHFHNFIAKSHIILTDSGGIQEEAPSLGKPVLVMRETTERPEGVAAGTLKLVGTNEDRIYTEFKNLLTDRRSYEKMSRASNPYGDGKASKRIADILSCDPGFRR